MGLIGVNMLILSVFGVLLFAILGACIGSFLTMATHRLPNKEDIIFKKSHCPKCGKELKIRSLIPIISFLWQRGKCLECGEKISIRYFLIEFVNCFAYVVLFLMFDFNFTCIYLCLLFSLIFTIIIVDIEHFEIPLYLQFPLLLFAVFHILFNSNIDPIYSMFSAFVYFVVIELCRILVEKIKHNNEVLGGGDTKIITICGLFLGLGNIGVFLLWTGIIGCIFGLLWRLCKKDKVFPFAMPIVVTLFVFVVRYYGVFG